MRIAVTSPCDSRGIRHPALPDISGGISSRSTHHPGRYALPPSRVARGELWPARRDRCHLVRLHHYRDNRPLSFQYREQRARAPGGAFAIIAGALGLEAGGAIGIPLFIAQSSSVALYLYAFTEGWAVLFPSHDPLIIAGIAFLLVSYVAYRSASLAFRAQSIMFIVVILALLSAVLGLYTSPTLYRPSLIATSRSCQSWRLLPSFFQHRPAL